MVILRCFSVLDHERCVVGATNERLRCRLGVADASELLNSDVGADLSVQIVEPMRLRMAWRLIAKLAAPRVVEGGGKLQLQCERRLLRRQFDVTPLAEPALLTMMIDPSDRVQTKCG
jgi:hypothetical protein